MPIFRPLTALFGGRAAQIWHIGFALELVLFVMGHALMVATTGLRNNLRSIVTGWAV
jgi:thiosulfate reductase cytochrome b subunit